MQRLHRNDLNGDETADTSGLKLIGLAFAVVCLAVTATTAAVVASVGAEGLKLHSTALAK